MKTFYKVFFLLIVNYPLSIINCFSQQAPGIEWQNTIGGNDDDWLYCIRQTMDGGYILGGSSLSNASWDKTENCKGSIDYWIVKTNGIGTIQWQNTIGGNDIDELSFVQQTMDSGYILGGRSGSNISGDKIENTNGLFDYWLVKTDNIGNIQWQNSIGGSQDDWLYSVQQTMDGGYILGGSSRSNISGDKTENNWDNTLISPDYWIVKTDNTGNIQWQQTIGGNGYDWLSAISQTPDSGYIIGGYSDTDISGDKTDSCRGYYDYWIVKTDSIGNIQWQNTMGGNSEEKFFSFQQTTDGGYILGGYSKSNVSGDKTENSYGSSDYWVVKINGLGNIQWQKTIGGNAPDILFSIRQTSDGGYILGGHSSSNISGNKNEDSNGLSDYWVVKLDNTGNILWQNSIGGSNFDFLRSVQQTSDNGYILGGLSASDISGDKTENCKGWNDYWIIKLLPDTTTGISNFQSSTSNFQISPNPSHGIFQITFPSSANQKTNYTVEVINTLGQTVFEAPPWPSPEGREIPSAQIDLSFLPKGIYVLRINDGVLITGRKIIIE